MGMFGYVLFLISVLIVVVGFCCRLCCIMFIVVMLEFVLFSVGFECNVIVVKWFGWCSVRSDVRLVLVDSFVM